MPERELPAALCNPAAFVVDDEVAIALIADIQVRKAIERGDFDDLPGSGQPLDLPENYDPDWWFKSLVRREHLTVLLPSSIQIRKDDAALDSVLDDLEGEAAVRHEVAEFNDRVICARYDLRPGPPMITQQRDPETTVAAWRRRKYERIQAMRALDEAHEEAIEEDRFRTRLRRRHNFKVRLGQWLHRH